MMQTSFTMLYILDSFYHPDVMYHAVKPMFDVA